MNLPTEEHKDNLTRVTKIKHQFPSEIIGLPITTPLLTWEVQSKRKDAVQLAYQILATDEQGLLTYGEIVSGDQSVEVEAPGYIDKARQIKHFQVRIATQYGWSDFSPVATFETGFASPQELIALAIGDGSTHGSPSPLLRKKFVVQNKVVKARLFVTSRGLNTTYLNGQRVSDEYLTPGWTAYDDRNTYLTFDVTNLVESGLNVISAELGDGWERGKLGFMGQYDNYGKDIYLVAQLEITLSDGSVQTIITDESWKTSTGEIQSDSIYDGTLIDFTKRQPGWQLAHFDDSGWSQVTAYQFDKSTLTPRISPKVKKIAEFSSTVLATDNRTLLNFSQNISGWVQLVVEGKKGDVITVRHAEVLEPGPKLHTAALRTAKATDVYVLGHDGVSVLEPAFTFHGFQYAEVTGPAKFVSAVGIAISSTDEKRSEFSSSDARLNRLYENVVWSARDNMVSVPTDCPQRDERLGWTGDAQAFAMTANTLFDVESFWRSWLIDLELDQDAEGNVAAVVPDVLRKQPVPDGGDWVIMGRAGWADAATIVPWSIYESYGSTDILKQQLRSMRRWADALDNRRKGAKFLPTEFQFGDWCDPDAPEDQPWKSKVSADFVANSFFVHTADLVAATEQVVGSPEGVAKYSAMADALRRDIWQVMGEEAKTTTAGCAIALEFNIVPDSERAAVAAILAEKVIADEGRITTGFLGTPLILHALSKSGHFDATYTMLMRRKIRSWLYQVDAGATTIWERWEAIREDGSIHRGEMATASEHQEDASMISFNHYAYGAVIDWVYRNVAGIAPVASQPGYREILFAPRPAKGFTYSKASINSPYGVAAIDWKINQSDALEVILEIPFGSTGIIDLPASNTSRIVVNGALSSNGARLTYGTYKVLLENPEVVQY